MLSERANFMSRLTISGCYRRETPLVFTILIILRYYFLEITETIKRDKNLLQLQYIELNHYLSIKCEMKRALIIKMPSLRLSAQNLIYF